MGIYNNSNNNPSIQKNNLSNSKLKERVKEMSDLLKQSNYYLDMSRQENKKIKEKYNALMNNYNYMKNADNSQDKFNSASFEEIKQYNKNSNNVNNISNQNISKNIINSSHLAVNQSNHQNNLDMYGNNSNSFNFNNNDNMNAFNNNYENQMMKNNLINNMKNNNYMANNQNQNEMDNDNNNEE